MSSNPMEKTAKKPKISRIPILSNTPLETPIQRRKTITWVQPTPTPAKPIVEKPKAPVMKVYDDRIRQNPTLLPFGVNLFECSPELFKTTMAMIEDRKRNPLHYQQ